MSVLIIILYVSVGGNIHVWVYVQAYVCMCIWGVGEGGNTCMNDFFFFFLIENESVLCCV